MNKPKANYAASAHERDPRDFCQTPGYALDPLIPYLDSAWDVWEPAAGEGYLADGLWKRGIDNIITTDIETGHDFFTFEPPRFDAIVTNPPWSNKYHWLERCYQLGKPFALLVPTETHAAASAIKLFRRFGWPELLQPDKRIRFKMPEAGWENSKPQMPVEWITWGLNIGRGITWVTVSRYPETQLPLLEAAR